MSARTLSGEYSRGKVPKVVANSTPEWMECIYNVLIKKKSNIQCGIEVRLDYSCPVVRSLEAVDLFAESWKAVQPLLDFVLSDA